MGMMTMREAIAGTLASRVGVAKEAARGSSPHREASLSFTALRFVFLSMLQ